MENDSNPRHLQTLGLDVGGTKLAGVLMAADGTINAKQARRTHGEEGGQAVLGRLLELAAGLLDHATGRVMGIGVATPGIVDTLRGSVRFLTTALPGWSGLPVAEAIYRRFALPVRLDNDGRAAALAEYRLGAGSGCANFVTVVVGTGVGGGIIVNGELARSSHGGGAPWAHKCRPDRSGLYVWQ